MTEEAGSLRHIPSGTAYHMQSIEHVQLAAEGRQRYAANEGTGLLIIEKGSGKIANPLLLVETGDTLLLQSEVVLELTAVDEPLCGYFILFRSLPSSNERDTVRQLADASCQPIRIKPTSKYLRNIKSLYTSIEDGLTPLQQFRLQLHFQSILYDLLATATATRSAPERDSLAAVRHSIAYLQEHYDEEHTVAQLACQLNLSSRQYTRLFRKLTGKSPIEFLNEYRINRSKELLLLQDEPSHQISSQIGIRDVTYFNRRFKQRVGCSPKEYVRNRHLDSRIVTPHYAGEILALGMQPIGSLEVTLNQLQPDAPPIRSIGYDRCQLEHVKALQPDLILVSDFTDRQEIAALGELAPVIVIPWDMNAFDRLHRVARVLGKEKEAEQWYERYRMNAQSAHQQCQRLSPPEETAAIVRMEEDRAWVFASRFFPTFYDVIGFCPTPLMQRTTEVNPDLRRVSIPLHQIEQLDADRLYIVDYDSVTFTRLFEQWKQASGWHSLTAVRKQQVYRLNMRGISNSAYTLEWQLHLVSCLLNPLHCNHQPCTYVALLEG